ncbi:MetQ/NlpA family ABC transporter substrate-binding protein [Caproicibacterium sp. BJN0003]|uniref:MetQ/NlpA family ABC transporter substrate-binding protein n=1 Tax=Caproicibacterium sp. BJN0003 TaxID=2994078 RepID=UPI0022594EDB|nr:MetQ/NlpA family ABC transporter substrate-binding protein [Caproicibacterium sp. BJN0003]UZT83065.1 MetQ/NlpA family ABC transporter substrate-binding protein [Caproicibacterium sp. BJN0003]
MKKLLSFVLASALLLTSLTACGSSTGTSSAAGSGTTSAASKGTIKVGASPTPHADILRKAVAPQLEKEGYTLEVVELTDYILPNTYLQEKELDANYFQHITYLKNFNTEHGTNLVSMGAVHYEPFGIYAGKTKSLSDLKDGATVAVPNDTTNEARALLLLQANGLLKLKDGAGINATKVDIVENPKNLNIQEIEAAQLPKTLPDVDIAVINGNYAIQNGLKTSDALAMESDNSVAVTDYANVLAVRDGDENREDLKALYAALTSEETQQYIKDTFGGGVVPVTK